MDLRQILSRGFMKAEEQQQRVFRFWLNREQTKEIIILDDEDEVVSAYEHRVLTISGRIDYVLCMKNLGEVKCALCESGNKRYLVYYLNIIDVDGYRTKDGRVVRNVKMVMPLKVKAAQALRTYLNLWKKKNSNLRMKYLRVTVTRLPLRDAPTTGDTFELIGQLTDEEIKKLEEGGVDLKPIDLEKVVKVYRKNEDLVDYMTNNVKVDEEEDGEKEDLPF